MTLPLTEIALTKPGAGKTHGFPEAVAFGSGFYVIYTETAPTTQFPFLPLVDTYVQQFNASGKPGAKKLL